jgi:hypothetical protein
MGTVGLDGLMGEKRRGEKKKRTEGGGIEEIDTYVYICCCYSFYCIYIEK